MKNYKIGVVIPVIGDLVSCDYAYTYNIVVNSHEPPDHSDQWLFGYHYQRQHIGLIVGSIVLKSSQKQCKILKFLPGTWLIIAFDNGIGCCLAKDSTKLHPHLT